MLAIRSPQLLRGKICFSDRMATAAPLTARALLDTTKISEKQSLAASPPFPRARKITLARLSWIRVLREAVNATSPGYISHEAAMWSDKLNKWVFLPRRISSEAYSDEADQQVHFTREFSVIACPTVTSMCSVFGRCMNITIIRGTLHEERVRACFGCSPYTPMSTLFYFFRDPKQKIHSFPSERLQHHPDNG